MTRRSKIWWVLAVLFTLVNAAGTVVAGAQGEVLHTTAHAVLVLAGAYVVWRLTPGRVARY